MVSNNGYSIILLISNNGNICMLWNIGVSKNETKSNIKPQIRYHKIDFQLIEIIVK